MRMSEWSSEVCSSDLRCLDGSSVVEFGHCFSTAGSGRGLAVEAGKRVFEHAFSVLSLPLLVGVIAPDNTAAIRVAEKLGHRFVGRSDERRVGKECVSTCRSRGSTYPEKNKKLNEQPYHIIQTSQVMQL